MAASAPPRAAGRLHAAPRAARGCARALAPRRAPPAAAATAPKRVYVRTTTKEAALAGVEAGCAGLAFEDSDEGRALAEAWRAHARFDALLVGKSDVTLVRDGEEERVCGTCVALDAPEDVDRCCAAAESGSGDGMLLASCADWLVIPAENLVAAYQNTNTDLVVTVDSADDARASLGALELGVDGVVLCSDSVAEVSELCAFVREAAAASAPRERLEAVTVTGGLLVGSFSRALALVHSECVECGYVRPREFRVNAGPLSSYVAAPGGRTAYLSELRAGDEVLVVDAEGRARAAAVARVKVEKRPITLLEMRSECGQELAVGLQNAETVRVVTPGGGALSVSVAAPGDKVLARVEAREVARHTGIAIEENASER
eukprot:PRCOL_00003957-RA